MPPETAPSSGTIASRPAPNIREMVEKVAREREAAAAAPPPAEKPPEAPPAKPPLDTETAIELERARAEHRVMSEKLARLEADSERFAQAEAARKSDWQRALADAGYKPEDVIPAWIQGGDAKPTAAPAASGKEAELVERLSRLEGVITGAKAESDRERRMRDVKTAMGEGDDYAVMQTIGADQGFLDSVLAEEKRRGVPIGSNELVQMLKAHEGKARDVVRPQIERLAKSAWGKQLLEQLLKDAAAPPPEEEKDEPAPSRASPMMGEDKPTIRLGRDLNATIEEAKRKALARMGK